MADPAILEGVPMTRAHQQLGEAAQREVAARAADGALPSAESGVPVELSHPLDSAGQSAAMLPKMRAAHEAQFPWYARLLRRLSRFPRTVYEFADSVDAHVRGIYREQRAQDLAIQELTQVANSAVTEINRVRGEYELLVRRVGWYEQQVPHLRRAKEEFDRLEAERLLAERERDRALRPPVLPFTSDGVRTVAERV